MTLRLRGQAHVDPAAEAAALAARQRADVEYRRDVAALDRQSRAADAEAARIERAARIEDARQRRTAAEERKRHARAVRRSRAAELAAALVIVGRKIRPVAPLALVTGFAMYGQVGYGLTHYPPKGTPLVAAWVIALGAALAVESIALYVAWHAHDALLMGATATAARLRRASYAIALGVAGINYAHFAGSGDNCGPRTPRPSCSRCSAVPRPGCGACTRAAPARPAPSRGTGRLSWRGLQCGAPPRLPTPNDRCAALVDRPRRHRPPRGLGGLPPRPGRSCRYSVARGRLLRRSRSSQRHTGAAPVPLRHAGWIDVPEGATVLPILATRPRNGVPVRQNTDVAPAPARPVPLHDVSDALPAVPAGPVRESLSAQALRERARQTYRRARDSGRRVTGAQLGEAYGRGERWGRAQIEAVDAEDAADTAASVAGGTP